MTERCDQLKYDKTKPPVLTRPYEEIAKECRLRREAQPKMFDCIRTRCPYNGEGIYCANPERWFTCLRMMEP